MNLNPTGENFRFKRVDLAGLVSGSFFLLVFSIPFLRPFLPVFGMNISLPEIIIVPVVLVWITALILRKTEFRCHRHSWLFILYFAALLLSAVFSENQSRSFIKLAGFVYLIGLALLTFNLIRTSTQLRLFCLTWLAATFVITVNGFLLVLLFYLDLQTPSLAWLYNPLGAVPQGNYPRMMLTLYSASLLCNYLVVSLGMLFISDSLGWISDRIFYPLYFLIMFTAVFTISSGLGGVVLMVGSWIWILFRKQHGFTAHLLLAGSVLTAAVFLAVSAIALERYPQAPAPYHLPFTETDLYPSSRVLVWTASANTFLDHPLTGVGIGLPAAHVTFTNTDGSTSLLTDAHNVFLSFAAQAGLPGLLATVLLMFFLIREVFPITRQDDRGQRIIRASLALTFFTGFVYQGLFGSFEDARHLWIVIGLILSFGKTTENTSDRNPEPVFLTCSQ